LSGHAPGEQVDAAGDAEDWDDERLGFQDRTTNEAA